MRKLKRVRVQFDMSRKAVDQLDQVVEMTGATSRAEVIRTAIRCYAWLVMQEEKEKR